MRKVLVLLICLLAGCKTNTTHSESTLRVPFSQHPTTIDPRKSGDFTSSTLICLLFEGLTRCNSGKEIELAAAERVEISEDQKTYRFFLRKSQWSDGVPVTADDFEASWKSALDTKFPSPAAYLFYPIKNAENYAKGKISLDQVGIRSIDSYTLEVELERPTPYFLSLTAFPLYLPIPHHVEDPFHSWEENQSLVQNGPFLLEKVVPNVKIQLKKNPSFWNQSLVHFDQLTISIVPDENTALQMFERKELDIVGGPLCPLPPDSLEFLEKSEHLHFIPMSGSTFCTFNTEKLPLSFRKALSLAIDRQKIIERVALKGQIFPEHLFPPALSRSKEPNQFTQYNPEKAREALQQALDEGNISLKELKPICLSFKTGQIERALAQTLQTEWKEILGIEVLLEQNEPKIHLKRLQDKQYTLAISSWIAQFDDPINLLERFKDKKNPKNYPGWESSLFAQMLEDAEKEQEKTKRDALLAQAEEQMSEEVLIAPLYHWSAPLLIDPTVRNFATTQSGGFLFERCIISRDEP